MRDGINTLANTSGGCVDSNLSDKRSDFSLPTPKYTICFDSAVI